MTGRRLGRRRTRVRPAEEDRTRPERPGAAVRPRDRTPRAVGRLDVVALLVALAPFPAAAARAALTGWMPVGDAAYFTVRSRDVFGGHVPLVGAWSSGSEALGTSVNNLGPLQLDLLAPFTSVEPYLGTAIGAATLNALAVAAVWLVAVRLVSPLRVVVVMAGTSLLVAALGLSWLVDVRQQQAMVLPFLALVWLAAGMAAGVDIAVPVAVGAASLVAQSHFTYVVPAAVVTLAGLAGWALAAQRAARIGRGHQVLAVAAVVAAVCWIQPLLDQWFGTGNLSTVLTAAGDGDGGAGVSAGVQIVAGAVLTPPFWLPGSLGSFLLPDDGATLAVAVVAAVVWLGGSLGVAVAGLRARRRAAAAIGGIAATVLVAAVAGASVVPRTSFGLLPQNYYWLWSVGAFVTTGVVVAASTLPPFAAAADRARGAIGGPALLGSLAVAVGLALWPRHPVEGMRLEEEDAARLGGDVQAAFAAVLDRDRLGDTVLVDMSRAGFGNRFSYVLLVELQRAGIEFRFAPGDPNLARFGDERCAQPQRLPRLALIGAEDPVLADGWTALTSVGDTTAAERAERARLAARFADLVRNRAVRVDVTVVREELGGDVGLLAQVTAADGPAPPELARDLATWQMHGLVELPVNEADAFARWVELERRSIAAVNTLALAPPAQPSRRTVPCAD